MSDPDSPEGRVAAGEWPPWPPPRPLEPPARERREFEAGGTAWLAWLAGGGVAGTGNYNLALIEAIQFAPASAPDRPERECLVAHGIFLGLHDAELVELLARAQRIGAAAEAEPRKRGGGPLGGRGGGPRRPRAD